MLSLDEKRIVDLVKKKTRQGNIDNISRTNCYELFYFCYKEIKWSLLASLVSRNAGWNMCDLEGKRLVSIMPVDYRNTLFSMYERANWLIFNDAYPQLLLYHYSTKYEQPMFHLLRFFQVSDFMIQEWNRFWIERNEKRLLYSLIINEQNLIQKPVIENVNYDKRIFKSLPFQLQEKLHFNTILFPTLSGKLYGATMKKFQKVDFRIEFGKQLAWILFSSGELQNFLLFVQNQAHTGSRFDYERYMSDNNNRDTPYLRVIFPIVEHFEECETSWDKLRRINKKWYAAPNIQKEIEITKWYKKKVVEMDILRSMNEWLKLNE